MLKISFSKSSQKILRSPPPKHKHQCALKIQALRLNPLPQDSKLLKGTSFFRCDMGEYRIVYQHNTEILIIILIDKRNDDRIYRRLSRLN
ncbi:MAG: addiction module toxin RelE [Alphaproteobacteria bacterium 16-39-46]|nr:MAG: addiction module toxin RelE [Alphaproteobacteria bacterium 16-39-46]OZA43751.1 MAG: addiction module toxin RelE [Alphaproteobacteria bacterium 17-39-52]